METYNESQKNKKTNRKSNHSIPGLSMAILRSFSDGRRNFWNRRVGSGVKDLNLIETEIPKPAGLLGDERSEHSGSPQNCFIIIHIILLWPNYPERAVYLVPE